MKSWIVVFLIRSLGILPFWLLQRLGGGLGRLLWLTDSRMAKVARRNLSVCFPEKSETERFAMAKTSILETGRSLIETAKVWTWSATKGEKRITNVRGEEHLQAARDAGKGIIWITLHHGNWEMLPFYFNGRTEITTMFKPTGLDRFDTWMTESRERFGLHMVSADRRGVMKLMHEIKANRDIMLLPDQEPSRSSGVFAPFFGVEALTGKLTTHLAQANTDAAIIFVYVKRKGGEYEVVLKSGSDAIKDQDFRVSATALNQDLERCIMDQPEHFQWGYKRFKQRPEGEEKFYKGF